MYRSLPLVVLLFASVSFADTYSTLSPTGTAPSPRFGHSVVIQPSAGRLILFGGGDVDPATQLPRPTNEVHALSLSAGAESWSQLSPGAGPSARMFHSAVYDSLANRLLVFGGLEAGLTTTNDLWELDLTPGSGSWRLMAPTGIKPPARFVHAAAFLPTTNQMVVFGGYTGTLPVVVATNDIWTLTLAAGDGIWAPVGIGGAPASAGHRIAYDSTANRILLFGVGDVINQTFSSDIYARYVPLATNSWILLPVAAPVPSPRQGFAQAFDVSTEPSLPRWLVLGGGQLDPFTQTGDLPGDGYVFESVPGSEKWVALTAANNPARTGLWAGGYDSVNKRLVLFGGVDTTAGFSQEATGLTLGNHYDPRLTTANPATGPGGQSLVVTLTGQGTAWVNGTSFANFGPEIKVNTTSITSPTTAVCSISILGSALSGPRNVGIITAGQTDSAIGIFTVDNPLRNILTGQGLADPNLNQVRVYDAGGTAQTTDFLAYSAGHWGVNVAAGDVDADGTDEALTGPGPGIVFGPQIRAFRRDNTPMGKINFFAYGTLKFGANVGNGDTDRDGFDEILSGAGSGAVFGPHVRGWNFDGGTLTAIARINYFAYGTLKFGVKAVSGDVDFDGYREILTAPGPGGPFGPQIRGWNVDGGPVSSMKINFFAFPNVSLGANAAAGDLDEDGFFEIVAAKGPGPGYDSQVKGFDYDGKAISGMAGINFTAYVAGGYGARVGMGSFLVAPGEEILTGPGPDSTMAATVHEYAFNSITGTTLTGQFDAFPGQNYGVNVVSGGFRF